jgi:hypothetical protein
LDAILRGPQKYVPRPAARERARSLKRLYGISVEEYDRLFAEQDGRCAICSRTNPSGSLDVDHNHKTGAIRGLLCRRCNLLGGVIETNPELVEKIKGYLDL